MWAELLCLFQVLSCFFQLAISSEPLERCAKAYVGFGPPCLVGLPGTFRPGWHSETKIREMMQEAMKSLRCCQQHEGRSWEIGLDVSNLNVTDVDDASRGEVGMFGIFCGPKECDESTIGPVAIGHLISELQWRVKSPKVSEAVELVPWENVTKTLDFIIAGAERCGTSSLHYNLFQHPVI